MDPFEQNYVIKIGTMLSRPQYVDESIETQTLCVFHRPIRVQIMKRQMATCYYHEIIHDRNWNVIPPFSLWYNRFKVMEIQLQRHLFVYEQKSNSIN